MSCVSGRRVNGQINWRGEDGSEKTNCREKTICSPGIRPWKQTEMAALMMLTEDLSGHNTTDNCGPFPYFPSCLQNNNLMKA